MFTPNTTVAWATKGNAFLGTVLTSNEKSTVVIVTSQMKGNKLEGKKIVVGTTFLGEVENGKAVVTQIR